VVLPLTGLPQKATSCALEAQNLGSLLQLMHQIALTEDVHSSGRAAQARCREELLHPTSP